MTTVDALPSAAPHAPGRGARAGRAGVFGIGAALPERVVTNDELTHDLDTSDAWIRRRTGIRARRRLDAGEPLADLAAAACAEALADAGREPGEVDRVVATTMTPDRIMPGMATDIAARLGLRGVAAYDLNAACAGFLVGLEEAAALVESGRARVVLVCAAEALSRVVDPCDRGTAVLFGDGAGAVVVAAGDLDRGCAEFVHGCDPTMADALYVDPADGLLRMPQGQAVYRHAVMRMAEATREALELAGCAAADVDLLVAHQANERILEAVAAELGLTEEQVAVDVDRVANTSSASIPLALHRAERDGRLRPGATVALAAFGAGFVWSAGVLGYKERALVCA